MNIETLQEELSVCLRDAQAHHPTPLEGSEALKALKECIQQRPVPASVGVPMILAGAQAWQLGLMQISLGYATLGIVVNMKGLPPTDFVKKLMEKEGEQ